MEKSRLDNELERIRRKFPYLWENYGFHAMYFTRDYGRYSDGFVIGLGNDICKLIFEKETDSPVESVAIDVGKKDSMFAPPHFSYSGKNGWYSLTGLIYWLTDVECERDKNVDQDLEYVSQYLKLYIDKLLDMFKTPEEFDSKLEYLRQKHKENQITVDKIREERARLKALGQDWSLEAAIASLRGGKK